jgi:DNA-binding NtrC family response regulator
LSGKPRILVIDDDETIRESVSTLLRREGYVVDTAETGKEAIAASTANFYNLAIIDIRLPDMEGVELLTAIKDTVPRIVKIIVTGYPSMETAINAVNNGADGYLMKPFKSQELLDKVAEHLKKQEEAMKYSEQKVADFVRSRARELDTATKT